MKKIFEALGDRMLARVVPKSEAHAEDCRNCAPFRNCGISCSGNYAYVYCRLPGGCTYTRTCYGGYC